MTSLTQVVNRARHCPTPGIVEPTPRAPQTPIADRCVTLACVLIALTISVAPAAALGASSRSSAAPATSSAASGTPLATLAVVEQPRDTGYFVGDKVTQRVLLERGGHPVSPVSLPPAGRVSAWFERRAATVQTDASSHPWLVVEYQILNAPPKLIRVKLPAWSLPIKGNSAAAVPPLKVPEELINVAPLSPPGSPTQVGSTDLRPDHEPPVIETASIRRAIEMSAGALFLTLIAWIIWVVWRNWRAMATQPFARALREMQTLDDGEPRVWQALHRAFDRTAGRVVQSATLPVLFERAPQLIPARAEIEQFFAQSRLLFFGGAPVAAGNVGGPSPRALCVELRRIEKRNER